MVHAQETQTLALALAKEQDAAAVAQSQTTGPTMRIGGRVIGPASGDEGSGSGGDGGEG